VKIEKMKHRNNRKV